jgi:hypothetical protein
MLINDIKKGMKLQLKNGFAATMADNAKGMIRTADVEGIYREIGSIYAHDISRVLNPTTGQWETPRFTEAQTKQANKIRSFGF